MEWRGRVMKALPSSEVTVMSVLLGTSGAGGSRVIEHILTG
jgi:hypothetical protein